MNVTGKLLFNATVRPKVTYRVLELDNGKKFDLVVFPRSEAAQQLIQSLSAHSSVTVEGELDTRATGKYPKLIVNQAYEGDEAPMPQSLTDEDAESFTLDDVFTDFFEGMHTAEDFGVTPWRNDENFTQFEKRRNATERKHRNAWKASTLECALCDKDAERMPHLYARDNELVTSEAPTSF